MIGVKAQFLSRYSGKWHLAFLGQLLTHYYAAVHTCRNTSNFCYLVLYVSKPVRFNGQSYIARHLS